MFRLSRLSLCISIILALLATVTLPSASAQAIYGTLTGRVLDPSRAPIRDAAVTVVDVATNARLVTSTGADGTFRFTRVAPGQYRLGIEKPGFRQHLREDVVVTVNEQVLVDAVLEVGSIEERVVVDERSPLVQARSAEVSGLVDQKRVRELPLNGGNFQRLALLAPGASGGGNNNPAFSGSRSVTNFFALDGGGFSDERGALGGVALGGGAADFSGASPSLVSTEAIREFRVITSNADATFGRGSGAQVNVVTRSGSNGFRGTSYYFGRNDALDARDFFNYGPFFDDKGNAVTPPFKQHRYGATLGGPLVRDKHFFFGSFEGFRQRLEQTASATVPNAALIGQIPGDLRRIYELFYIGKGIIPATGDPAGALSMALTGTDSYHHQDFATAAEVYRRRLVLAMNSDLAYGGSSKKLGAYTADQSLWSSIPPFEYRQPGLGASLSEVRTSAAALLVWAVAAGAALVVSVRRMAVE